MKKSLKQKLIAAGIILGAMAIIWGGALIQKHEGMPFRIETISTAQPLQTGAQATEIPQVIDNRININTADALLLDTLDGIGEATANKIIEYRENHGNFKVIEDIMNVDGIGQKKFEAIKDKICVASEE